MIVRVVRNWDYPKNFFKQTPGGHGIWGEVSFTEEPIKECDFLIVLQNPNKEITVRCPVGNKWLIAQDPPVKGYRFCTNSFKHFDRVYSYYKNTQHPFLKTLQPVVPWHVDKSYDELANIGMHDLKAKNDGLVWITSNKTWFPGHKKRMEFKDRLMNSELEFELLGKGFKEVKDKFDGLFPVKYSLAVENFQQQDYWTEKLADCFLSWNLPFYYGASNIEDFFPPESFIRIDINDYSSSIVTIKKAMENNEWEKRLSAIEEARNLVLNHYQFFPYISNMVKSSFSPLVEKQNTIIPANNLSWFRSFEGQVKYYSKRIYQGVGKFC